MSTRERWVVYPLLFLTLGIALRDKVVPPSHFQAQEISTNQLRCGQLQVAQLQVGQIACRELLVNGPTGRPVVVARANGPKQDGLVETFSGAGAPLVLLHSTEGGGVVSAVGRDNKVVAMGNLDRSLGVFAQLPDRGLTIPLTQFLMHETKDGDSTPKKTELKDAPKEKVK